MKNRLKKELMAAARRAGWKGKTYRGAKQFDRKLTLQAQGKWKTHRKHS